MYTSSSSSSRAELRYYRRAWIAANPQTGGRTDGRSVCRHVHLARHIAPLSRSIASQLVVDSVNVNRRLSLSLLLPPSSCPSVLSLILFFGRVASFPRAFSLMHDSRLNRSTSTARVRGTKGWLAWNATGTFIPAENRGTDRVVTRGRIIDSPRSSSSNA